MQRLGREQKSPEKASGLRIVCQRFSQLRQSISNSFHKSHRQADIDPSQPVYNADDWPEHFGSISALLARSPSTATNTDKYTGPHLLDGTMDKMFKRTPASKGGSSTVASIFVHAGAGYHSSQNEHVHLGACDSAARMAMRVLKNGGSAVDAVEAAIKVLEDKEITNAGFGSNLAIDGVVECDATIVDHLGRSGACGATAQIKNPIHLARAILDASNKPLSLRRVPPNLLVGQGATDFAWEQGIPVVPHEMLVSRNARDRYIRWREDLKRAEQHGGNMTPASSADSTAGEEVNLEYEEQVRAQQRRDHTQAILNGTWNEGQPDSPVSSPQGSPTKDILQPCPSLRHCPSPLADKVAPHNPRVRGRSPQSPSQTKRPRHGSSQQSEERRAHFLLAHNAGTDGYKSAPDVSMTRTEALVLEHARTGSDGNMSPSNEALSSDTIVSLINDSYFPVPGPLGLYHEGTAELPSNPFTQAGNEESVLDEDAITDTVGAIAIDMYGQIAAGASSGGIGMKHRGRVGPAALVGIGTAVIPADDRDPESISVAAVTSGTGEHMATTMASQKCAERLYFNTRRGHGGADIEATEEEAIESFVQADFMGHPGVRNSNSTGAIGVMAVKKTPYGYFLHFAHNTDSFALASMHSNENNAKCVMSRIGDHGSIVRGGRKIRVD